eukprot:TRINITY_DN6858_c0_g2_i2.p1 TRINITY_DN6858_c0_g2~~TRINITY_DN6858_c0_g2_i2.p1  ORF type:complete len:116 (-),score=32.69 TRINITY_DN6858_c0_g2_i2:11-358(-)
MFIDNTSSIDSSIDNSTIPIICTTILFTENTISISITIYGISCTTISIATFSIPIDKTTSSIDSPAIPIDIDNSLDISTISIYNNRSTFIDNTFSYNYTTIPRRSFSIHTPQKTI